MGRYVIRRLLQFIPTVIFTMFLLHYLTTLAIQFTGNPVRALFGDRQPPPEVLEQLTRRLGLDDPCLRQRGNPCLGVFADRMEAVFLHWDFGTNLRFREVTEIVSAALPYTLRLALVAFLFDAGLGLLAGVLAGLRGGSFWDYLVKTSTVVIVSVPTFVQGVIWQQFGGVSAGNWMRHQEWIPELISRGVFTTSYKSDYPWASLIIPGLVLGAINLATTARLTRTALQENMRADFVRTAKAKGLARKRVVGVHTLRNSLIPVVTNLGIDLGVLMGGAVVTEFIFNIPGIGRAILAGIQRGEAPVVIGITTLLVLVYLIANLVVDLLYAVLDPRIRYE
jgi:peptide/nickel transport system permease protein/oligopeptide transport system permease protein